MAARPRAGATLNSAGGNHHGWCPPRLVPVCRRASHGGDSNDAPAAATCAVTNGYAVACCNSENMHKYKQAGETSVGGTHDGRSSGGGSSDDDNDSSGSRSFHSRSTQSHPHEAGCWGHAPGQFCRWRHGGGGPGEYLQLRDLQLRVSLWGSVGHVARHTNGARGDK